METAKEKDFWSATALLITTASVMAAILLHWVQIGFFIGPFRLNHWFALIGTAYVIFAVPTIALLKRRLVTKYLSLLRVHVFGNLLAFMLISFHFASQISRPAAHYPELGTGIALYTAFLLLAGTGFLQRFHLIPRIKPQWTRFVHVSSAFVFYLIIIVHILHGLGIL
jgi:hypothetical protein